MKWCIKTYIIAYVKIQENEDILSSMSLKLLMQLARCSGTHLRVNKPVLPCHYSIRLGSSTHFPLQPIHYPIPKRMQVLGWKLQLENKCLLSLITLSVTTLHTKCPYILSNRLFITKELKTPMNLTEYLIKCVIISTPKENMQFYIKLLLNSYLKCYRQCRSTYQNIVK